MMKLFKGLFAIGGNHTKLRQNTVPDGGDVLSGFSPKGWVGEGLTHPFAATPKMGIMGACTEFGNTRYGDRNLRSWIRLHLRLPRLLPAN